MMSIEQLRIIQEVTVGDHLIQWQFLDGRYTVIATSESSSGIGLITRSEYVSYDRAQARADMARAIKRAEWVTGLTASPPLEKGETAR